MSVAAGPKLAAAVTNAGKCRTRHSKTHVTYCVVGGIGVIGGIRQSPQFLQGSIDEIKAHLEDKNAAFGVDLLIPQLGGNARKTNVSFPSYFRQSSCAELYMIEGLYKWTTSRAH
jgi:NAD(P)H-dependent flavin oxidoreductase YrpB (nitropropane dioxygenase family)